MSNTHLNTTPGTSPADQAAIAIEQAQAVAELLSIQCGDKSDIVVFDVLLGLLAKAARLIVAIDAEGGHHHG